MPKDPVMADDGACRRGLCSPTLAPGLLMGDVSSLAQPQLKRAQSSSCRGSLVVHD